MELVIASPERSEGRSNPEITPGSLELDDRVGAAAGMPVISVLIEIMLDATGTFRYSLKYEKARRHAALAALAQENRLDVFRLLVQAGPEGMPAGEVATKLTCPLTH